VALVSSALTDSDAMVRRRALGVVASRAAAARLGGSEERLKQWHRDRPALKELQPAVMRLLEDPDPFVRRDAIVALGNVDFVPRDNGRGEITLTDEALRLFAARYHVDDAALVREELVKSLVLIANRSEAQEAVVLKALADPSPGVVQFAVTGAGKMAIRAALPTLADLLISHSDSGVRLNVAQAFASYGAAAREYVTNLRIAASAEQNPIVRQTLVGTLTLLEK
jgi:HEAT repeat protein